MNNEHFEMDAAPKGTVRTQWVLLAKDGWVCAKDANDFAKLRERKDALRAEERLVRGGNGQYSMTVTNRHLLDNSEVTA